ncbi:MAG: aminotransferase class I/II-fold pyridoxal phosphate-dependent enzyme [Archangium sp.]|nr:aminotransferase class I/II-fold pyridoxal phosphate-dependent enzyme [Archangium sp.]
MIQPARHIANVKYAIRNIAAEAARLEAQGMKILPCNIGDPLRFDFATPPHLSEAVERALRDGHNHYVPSAGLKEAREAVAASLQPTVRPEDVFITAGVSEALDLALTALLEVGDEVLLPSPGYPLYNAIATRLQATVVPYFLDESKGWALDAEEIAAKVTSRTRAIVICNPNNPTGAVATRTQLEQVLAVARKHRLVVLSDEIYDRVLFSGEHVPTATLCDDVPLITLNGLSKAYLCPGWRVGWLAFNTPKLLSGVAASVQRLADARLCGPGPFQYAVKAALEGPQDHLPQMMKKLRARRDLMMKRLRAMPGISVVEPQGAFYALPSIERAWAGGDEAFVLELVRETGVLFVHGDGFGQRPGTRHFRVVFLPSEPVLSAAFDGLEGFLRARS